MMRMRMERRRLWALLPALLVAAVWALLFHGGGDLYYGAAESDLTNYVYPWRTFMHRWLQRGVVPWWNPHLFGGLPVLEIQQMGLFYPVTLTATALIHPRLSLLAEMAVHTSVAAVGLWLCLRRGLAVSGAGAALGTCVYVFGALYTVRVSAGHVTVVAALAWWPWAMLGTVRLGRVLALAGPGTESQAAAGFRTLFSRTGRPALWKWLVATAAANAVVILVGAPQYVAYLGYMELAALAALVPPRRWAGCIVPFGLAWVGALVLSTPQWLPTLFYLPLTGRAAASSGMGRTPTVDLVHFLFEFLLPFPFGDDLRLAHLHRKNVWETYTYPGVAALVFTAALVWRGVRRGGGLGRARRRVCIVLLLLSLYMLVGGWLPGFGGFREALKARAVTAFALSWTAAIGYDVWWAGLRRGRGSGRRETMSALALGAVAVAVAAIVASAPSRWGEVVLRLGPPFDPAAGPTWLLVTARPSLAVRQLMVSASEVAVVSLLFALLLYLSRRRRGHAGAAVAIAGAMELFVLHSYAFYSRSPFQALETPEPLRTWIAGKLEQSRRAGEVPWRVTLPYQLINRSMLVEGLYETGGYDPLMPAAANNRHVLTGSVGYSGSEGLSEPERSALRRLRNQAIARRYDLAGWMNDPTGKHTLSTPGSPHAEITAAIAGLTRQVEAGAPEPGTFGPRVDGTTFVVPAELAGRRVHSEEVGAEVRHQLNTVSRGAGASKRDRTERLEMLPLARPDTLTFKVRVSTPALLVLRTTWLPGWQVRVDGARPQEPLVANHWTPAVIVPEGEHQVEFFYRPVGLTGSLSVACAGWVGAAGLLLWCRGRTRGGQPARR